MTLSLSWSVSLNLTAFDYAFMHSQRYVRIASTKTSVETFIIHELDCAAVLRLVKREKAQWITDWCLNFVLFIYFLFYFILFMYFMKQTEKRCMNNFNFEVLFFSKLMTYFYLSIKMLYTFMYIWNFVLCINIYHVHDCKHTDNE